MLIGSVTHRAVHQAQEQPSLSVMLYDDMPQSAIDSLMNIIRQMPGVNASQFVSRDSALSQWQRETGENLVEIVGENPLADVIEVMPSASSLVADSLQTLTNELLQLSGVERVMTDDTSSASIAANSRHVMWLLGCLGFVLLTIALTLIFSTVRLRIHAQRHEIHTMTLVGAKTGFITRPFALRGAIQGTAAGIIASLAGMAVTSWLAHDPLMAPDMQEFTPIRQLMGALALIAMGCVGCATATWVAAWHYTKLSEDEIN